MRILMVCLGNICRSPIAEGVLKHKVKEYNLDWTIDSAGTEHYHIGERPHKISQKVCKERGIDISEQCARLFVCEDLDRYDKIYALADDIIDEIKYKCGAGKGMGKVDLLMNELYPDENISVPDPYMQPEKDFIAVFDMIDAACEAIVKKYK